MPFRSSSIQSKLLSSADDDDDDEPETLPLSRSLTTLRPWPNPSFLNLPSALHRASSSQPQKAPQTAPSTPLAASRTSPIPFGAWWRTKARTREHHAHPLDDGTGAPQFSRGRRRTVRLAVEGLGACLCVFSVVAGVGLLFRGLPGAQRGVEAGAGAVKLEVPL